MIGERTIDVLVDDVEDHRDAVGMAGIDQRFQPIRAAVGVVGRVEQHPVVAPAPCAGELGDREELDGVDTERDQVVRTVTCQVRRTTEKGRVRLEVKALPEP